MESPVTSPREETVDGVKALLQDREIYLCRGVRQAPSVPVRKAADQGTAGARAFKRVNDRGQCTAECIGPY